MPDNAETAPIYEVIADVLADASSPTWVSCFGDALAGRYPTMPDNAETAPIYEVIADVLADASSPNWVSCFGDGAEHMRRMLARNLAEAIAKIDPSFDQYQFLYATKTP